MSAIAAQFDTTNTECDRSPALKTLILSVIPNFPIPI